MINFSYYQDNDPQANKSSLQDMATRSNPTRVSQFVRRALHNPWIVHVLKNPIKTLFLLGQDSCFNLQSLQLNNKPIYLMAII